MDSFESFRDAVRPNVPASLAPDAVLKAFFYGGFTPGVTVTRITDARRRRERRERRKQVRGSRKVGAQRRRRGSGV